MSNDAKHLKNNCLNYRLKLKKASIKIFYLGNVILF